MTDSTNPPRVSKPEVAGDKVDPAGYSKSKSTISNADGAVMSPLATILPNWDLLPEQQQIIRRSGTRI